MCSLKCCLFAVLQTSISSVLLIQCSTHIYCSFSQHGVYIIFQGTQHHPTHAVHTFWTEDEEMMCEQMPNASQIKQTTLHFTSWLFHAFTFSTSIYRLSSHENSQATCCRLAFIIKLQTEVYFLVWQQIKQPARKSSLQGNGNKVIFEHAKCTLSHQTALYIHRKHAAHIND